MRLDAGRQRLDKGFHREGPVEANLDDADLFAARIEPLGGLLGGFGTAPIP